MQKKRKDIKVQPFITIFTPTYNRCDKLKRLYKSILSQNNKNLEWLIVDDGSTDGTKDYISKIIEDNEVNIRYIHKSNGGKYTAYNEALKNANGYLFFCVDSDDMLSDSAIDKIYEFWYSSDKTDCCCGIIAMKSEVSGRLRIDDLPENVGEITLWELDNVYKCWGDKCFIFITSIAKKYFFPEIGDEKFFPESYIYDKIGLEHSFLIMNTVLNECEYFDGGYTDQLVKLMLKNPTGYKIFYSQRIDMAYTLKKKMGYIIRYNVFKYLSKDKNYDYKGKYRKLVKLFGFVGIFGKGYYMLKLK